MLTSAWMRPAQQTIASQINGDFEAGLQPMLSRQVVRRIQPEQLGAASQRHLEVRPEVEPPFHAALTSFSIGRKRFVRLNSNQVSIETLTMQDSQRVPGADTNPPWRASRLVKVVVLSLLVLVAMSLGWLGLQLFLASVV